MSSRFDVLHDLEVVGRRELSIADFIIGNFVNERLVDPLRRQRLDEAFACVLVGHPASASCQSPFDSLFLSGGLTISLDGDLDEFERSFVALAKG